MNLRSLRLLGGRARRVLPHLAGGGLALAACGILLPSPSWAAREYSVVVDGKPVKFDSVGPVQVAGRVLVPLRGVLERTGAKVNYSPEKKTITATRGTLSLELPLGQRSATVNGKSVKLDVPAMMMRGTTMVPLRFVVEALGAGVVESKGKIRIATRQAHTTVAANTHSKPPVKPAGAQGTKPRVTGSTPGGDVKPSAGSTGIRPAAGGTKPVARQTVTGTLEQVSADAAAPAITVRSEDKSIECPLAPGAVVLTREGDTGTAREGSLKEILPGDRIMAKLDANGKITILVAQYEQVGGEVAVVGAAVLELKDGKQVELTDKTRVALADGRDGTRQDLHTGDTIRARVRPGSREAALVTVVKAGEGTAVAGGGTTPAGGETTTPAGGGTTPAGGEATTPAGGEGTKPAGGETATPAGGEGTKPAGGETATPAGGEGTKPAGGESTTPAGGEGTKPAGGEVTPAGPENTTPAGGEGTKPAGGEGTAPAGGEGVRGTPELKVTSFTQDAKGPLKANSVLTITMEGDAGGQATFDVGDLAKNQAMQEVAPGKYVGTFTIPAGQNARVSVMGKLTREGKESPLVQAGVPVVIDSTPPTTSDMAPAKETTVTDPQPVIYAVYEDPNGSGVDQDKVKLVVAGEDVTARATRTPRFITYRPVHPFANGPVAVKLTVEDLAGNQTETDWQFAVNAPEVAITSVAHNADRPIDRGQSFTVTVSGKPHCKASFDIGTMKVGIPMAETTPGMYQGRYVAEKGDVAMNAVIVAHLVSETGDQYSRECSEPITIVTVPPKAPTITSPSDGDVVEGSVVVTGKAQPGVTVRVQMVRITHPLGLWAEKNVVSAHEVKVDVDGSFATGKIAVPRGKKGEVLTLQALAIDAAGHRSEVVSVKVKM